MCVAVTGLCCCPLCAGRLSAATGTLQALLRRQRKLHPGFSDAALFPSQDATIQPSQSGVTMSCDLCRNELTLHPGITCDP
jgi:hypothetical protein